MKGQMTIIKTDGSRETIESETALSLEQLQKAVEGYIEVVPFFEKLGRRKCVAFCNERGKMNHLPANTVATILWHEQTIKKFKRPVDDILVGPIAVITGDEEFLDAL